MLDVLFLYPRELDVAAIDGHLTQHLVPEFSKARGLRSLHVSDGTLMSRGGPSPYSRVLEASFDSLADWMALVDALNATGPPPVGIVPLVVHFEATEVKSFER